MVCLSRRLLFGRARERERVSVASAQDVVFSRKVCGDRVGSCEECVGRLDSHHSVGSPGVVLVVLTDGSLTAVDRGPIESTQQAMRLGVGEGALSLPRSQLALPLEKVARWGR